MLSSSVTKECSSMWTCLFLNEFWCIELEFGVMLYKHLSGFSLLPLLHFASCCLGPEQPDQNQPTDLPEIYIWTGRMQFMWSSLLLLKYFVVFLKFSTDILVRLFNDTQWIWNIRFLFSLVKYLKILNLLVFW